MATPALMVIMSTAQMNVQVDYQSEPTDKSPGQGPLVLSLLGPFHREKTHMNQTSHPQNHEKEVCVVFNH